MFPSLCRTGLAAFVGEADRRKEPTAGGQCARALAEEYAVQFVARYENETTIVALELGNELASRSGSLRSGREDWKKKQHRRQLGHDASYMATDNMTNYTTTGVAWAESLAFDLQFKMDRHCGECSCSHGHGNEVCRSLPPALPPPR